MTCIVGIAVNGAVILGADSMAGDGYWNRRVRADRKVFKNGELIFGFTTSFRMGQLLEHNLTPPPIQEGMEPYAYAVKLLIPEIRNTLRSGGFMKTENGVESGGTFLVGFRGALFEIDHDFQVAQSTERFEAVGCGAQYAMGAMHIAYDQAFRQPRRHDEVWASDPEVAQGVLQAGLNAAARFSAGVAGPFHFVQLDAKQRS